ncbi:DUF1904 domain-containing protein [Crassaminicella thermophila]|uniref:DUF1904 domain-containing protein n=1 Tax=Crassaminicella thermophila TaxID=2599308 RepID=A0A5C0SCC1_CRATE|nr:DUF1904 domain-containing protein [Crassaminicella thermophila]QEK11356.1 DUF1904 domain-containing protein [Crassaminicella thermophila]
MPHIRVRGMGLEKLKNISKKLVDDLENIIGCPRDYFTLEYIPSTFIMDGEEDKGYPFIEVLWFDRGQEVQDQAAKAITDRVNNTNEYEDVCVIFRKLEEKCYYENGEHF